MVVTQNKLIHLTELEIDGIQYERQIRKILEKISEHQLLSNRYLSGNSSLKGEIIALQALINSDSIDKILESDVNTSLQEENIYDLQGVKPGEIINHWSHDLFHLNDSMSNGEHQQLVDEIRQLSKYVGEKSNLPRDIDIDSFNLTNPLLTFFPEIQGIVPQIMRIGEGAIEKKLITRDEKRELIGLMALLEYNVLQSKEALEKGFLFRKKKHEDTQPQEKLDNPLKAFTFSAQTFLIYIDKHLLNESKIDAKATEFISLGNAIQRESFVLRDATSVQAERLLKERAASLRRKQYLIIFFCGFLCLLGIIFRIFYIRDLTEQIQQLVRASTALAEGDLSVRIPESKNNEFIHVERSFNMMADAFEALIGQLQRAGTQLTTSTAQITAAAKEQEETVIELEATTKEISATAKDFAKTMNEVSAAAEQTTSLAVSGKSSLSIMEQIMQQMVEASGNIASKLAILNERAGTITNVITTITKVADQTNLLSLNVAIEAEKAGEHGRSFSVIAQEIRRLADQTANATLDIEKMVNEMVSAVSTGVMSVDKFSEEIGSGVLQVGQVSEQFSKIIEQFQIQTTSFENVNQGMQAQSLRAEQINDSINQLSETAQQTTDSIRQLHKAIEGLIQSSKEMQGTTEKIKR